MGDRRTYRALVASWLLVAAWAAFIFLMSANTGDSLSGGSGLVSQVFQWLKGLQAQLLPEGVDMVNPAGHFCEYLIFGALLANAWHRTGAPPARAAWLAAACASLYGITDELHQLFVPGRTADPLDWLVDTGGAAIGALVVCLVIRRAALRRAGTRQA